MEIINSYLNLRDKVQSFDFVKSDILQTKAPSVSHPRRIFYFFLTIVYIKFLTNEKRMTAHTSLFLQSRLDKGQNGTNGYMKK